MVDKTAISDFVKLDRENDGGDSEIWLKEKNMNQKKRFKVMFSNMGVIGDEADRAMVSLFNAVN